MPDKKQLAMRVDDTFLTALDATVREAGETRSAWLKALISPHIGLEKPPRRAPRYGDDDERVQVSVRLNRRELSALEGEAKSLGIHRADMMRKLLRSQLYDGDEFVILSPETKRDLKALEAQLRKLGRMINRSEMKINSALRDETLHELKDHAVALVEMRESVEAAFDRVAQFVSTVCAEEHHYWRGSLDEAALRKPIREAYRTRKGETG